MITINRELIIEESGIIFKYNSVADRFFFIDKGDESDYIVELSKEEAKAVISFLQDFVDNQG